MEEKGITFATAFYPVQSKFPSSKYIQWTTNFFSIVNEFYLVVFTDENTKNILLNLSRGNSKIRIVVRSFQDFHGIKYLDFWKKNYEKNYLLKRTCWELNMLWNEKIWMVNDIIEKGYFPKTEYYGWADIGYFRNEPDNINTSLLGKWANYNRLVSFSKDKVHYALVNPIGLKLSQELRTSVIGISINQTTIAGGFFFGGKDPLLQWRDIFTKKLEYYVRTGSLLKDDQIIVLDCILDNDINNPVVLHQGTGQNCSCQNCNHGKMVYMIYRQDMLIHYNNKSPFPLSCCHSAGIDDWFLFQKLLV